MTAKRQSIKMSIYQAAVDDVKPSISRDIAMNLLDNAAMELGRVQTTAKFLHIDHKEIISQWR